MARCSWWRTSSARSRCAKARQFNVIEVIKDAAAEVDRPLFYAVAVIVVSFLPIYVLSGPSGTLFKPMADTMVFALIGSLIVTLTLAAGAVRLVHAQGRARTAQRHLRIHQGSAMPGAWITAWRSPWRTVSASAVVLALSLLLIPFIGAEFMPHLDEGALWVRATMPYTISFDESAKIAPKIRDILQSFPEVTTVASELGRPG